MFKVGDRVQFIDGSMTRLLPHFYPAVFSKGRVIEVDEETESNLKYQVKWDNNKTISWYYTDKEIRKVW